MGAPPAVPTSICVTATDGLEIFVDLLPFWKRLATHPFVHLPATFEYVPVAITFERSADNTAAPLPTDIAVIFVVGAVATICSRLFVFAVNAIARLSTHTDGTFHIVYSK